MTALATLLHSGASAALDKQGSAHGGQVAGADHGLGVSGSLLLGAALYNPSYAARPDNTGLALLRAAPHFDVDLIGTRLSIPIDLNVFSDRQRRGLSVLAPSELDVISGVTSTWPLGAVSALELGARIERDMSVDRGSYSQSYADGRARLLFDSGDTWPQIANALRHGALSGALTLGWFAWNPSYAARPDNSGRALLRYGAHVAADAFEGHVGLGLDATSFTDREKNGLVPSELDGTIDLVGRYAPFELHLSYERDMPLDRGGLVQELLTASGVWSFELAHQ
ncbi:MAG TPA: hypothetical protein VG937_11505 [Polyangiaceae bacterium]|nr:hypothetical protein [Polyangiaceae bacterium]